MERVDHFEYWLCTSINWITKFRSSGRQPKKIFTDHLRDSKSKRPGLESAIEYARAGDKIVVWRLDRLGRKMEDLIYLVNRLNEQEVCFHRTQENITMDKSSSTGQLIFHLFAAFVEFERNLILERSSTARARGRFGGRPESFFTDHGSDFTSRHLEQVAIDLKIRLAFSKLGIPRGRGKIERFFLSINQLLLDSLPGYTKNRTTEKLLTIQELDKQIVHFLIYDYNHRIHSSTQKTPVDYWNESGFSLKMTENLEDLDLLLLHVSKSRKVHSDGIRFQGFRYINTNLPASLCRRISPNPL